MSQAWQRVGVIASGGTVFNLTSDREGRLWIATGAGIFSHQEDGWYPLPKGQPLPQLNTLACADSTLIAGGVGQIVYSADGGNTWHQSRISGVTEPITCIVPSPSFEHDRVVLAGTDGAGVLRSTDGGKNWRHANFGLQDFSVLALATAPEWGRREITFAATARGLYQSPNAGRAWKRSDVGMENTVVQLVVVSPNFFEDGTVFAGSEDKGLFRSTDGGWTWHPWGEGLVAPDEAVPINALWLHPDFPTTPVCLIGTGDARILRSTDGGATWTTIYAGEAPVLTLSGAADRVYAGLHDQGLLYSDDDGQTWQLDETLAARAVTRLVSGARRELYAFGPLEGIWYSGDAAETWAFVPGLEERLPIYAVAASPHAGRPCLLAGTATGLLRSEDHGQHWQLVLDGVEVTSIIFSSHFSDDGHVWVGTSAGELLHSTDGGVHWSTLRAPQPGVPVVALINWPRPQGVDLLMAATYHVESHQMVLWRSADGGNTWSQWMEEVVDWPSVHIAPAGAKDEGIFVCAGRTCWRFQGGHQQVVLETETPIARLLRLPDINDLVVLTPDQVLRSSDGEEWAEFNEGLGGQPLIDLALVDQRLYGLGPGGAIWRWE